MDPIHRLSMTRLRGNKAQAISEFRGNAQIYNGLRIPPKVRVLKPQMM